MFKNLFPYKNIKLILFITGILLLITNSAAFTQNDNLDNNTPVPVKLEKNELFIIRTRAGSFDQKFRASVVSERIKVLAQDHTFNPNELKIEEYGNYSDIVYKNKIITTVTDNDARVEGIKRNKLALNHIQKIRLAVAKYQQSRSFTNIFLGLLYMFGVTLLLIWAFGILDFVLKKLLILFGSNKDKIIRPIKIQDYELLNMDRIVGMSIFAIRNIALFSKFALLYFYFIIIFGFFPWTAELSQNLMFYIFSAAKVILESIISYVPNMLFILLVLTITLYLNRFIKFLFKEINTGNIKIPGFYTEWAETTSKIIRFLIFAMFLAIIAPYLPGAKTDAFKGLSIFIGVLISLGSTSAIANIVAGVILTYTNAFKISDRLKIGETIGDIIDKTLLVTRIRTIKYEIISIPNSIVLTSHIINYSSFAQTTGLILHTEVTIGYDAPWRKVHELLIDAANCTENIIKDPQPFVLQTKLDDFYINYEINAYTNRPNIMANTYSELHQNIQDKFNEAGVEIMSPHYSALRDGNEIAIPQDYIPDNYRPTSFQINKNNK